MKILKLMLAVTFVSLLFSGCTYNFIVPEEVPVIDVNDPDAPQISFATDILPIFNNGNNCTSCHKAGGQMPSLDLTTDKAYASLSSTRYLNSASPEESVIYLHPNPETTTHMHKKYTAAQAALILGWIQQGAKNN